MENVISHLNAVLGYTSNVFDAPATRVHFIDERKLDSYVAPRKTRLILNKYEMTDWQKRALMIVDCNEKTTGDDLAKKTQVSRNHASTTLTALYKANMVLRHKVKVGNKWAYAYTGKKNDTRSST